MIYLYSNCDKIFWGGLSLETWGFSLVLVFAPIQSSPSLEIPSTPLGQVLECELGSHAGHADVFVTQSFTPQRAKKTSTLAFHSPTWPAFSWVEEEARGGFKHCLHWPSFSASLPLLRSPANTLSAPKKCDVYHVTANERSDWILDVWPWGKPAKENSLHVAQLLHWTLPCFL